MEVFLRVEKKRCLQEDTTDIAAEAGTLVEKMEVEEFAEKSVENLRMEGIRCSLEALDH